MIDSPLEDYEAYVITNSENDGVLEVEGDTLYNEKYWDHAAIGISANPQNKTGKWHVIYDSSDEGVKYYELRNLFSGKYLNVPEDVVGEEGAQLEQIGYQPALDNKDGQLWLIDEEPGGGKFVLVNKASEKALSFETSGDGADNIVQKSKTDEVG